MIEVAVLGPVRVSIGGRPVGLPTTKSRAVLALLALNARTPVGLREMQERLWGSRPPPTAIAALRNNVSTLRKAFGDTSGARIETSDQSYALRVDPHSVDLELFDLRVAHATLALRAGKPEEAADGFRDALAVWRGPALVDLVRAGYDWPEIRRLDERRLDALELRIEADLRQGRHREVAAELEWLMREYPGREGFYRQHIVAAEASGRGADAAETYVRARAAMLTHHGRPPTEVLEQAHRALLTRRAPILTAQGQVTTARPSEVGGQGRETPPTSGSTADRTGVDGVAPGDADTEPASELRRVVVLCIRFGQRGEGGPVPWPDVLGHLDGCGGHAEEPNSHLVTAYFGLFAARPDDLTHAVRGTMAVRRMPGVPAFAATIMSGTVLRATHDRTATPASWVSGEVVASCQERVRSTPLGSVVIVS